MHIQQLNEASQVTFNPPLSTFFPEDQLPDIMKSLKKLMIAAHKHKRFTIAHNASFNRFTKEDYIKMMGPDRRGSRRTDTKLKPNQKIFNLNDNGTAGYVFLQISPYGCMLVSSLESYVHVMHIDPETGEVKYENRQWNPVYVSFGNEDEVIYVYRRLKKKKSTKAVVDVNKQARKRLEKLLSLTLGKTLEQAMADVTGRLNDLIKNRALKTKSLYSKWEVLNDLINTIQSNPEKKVSEDIVNSMLAYGIEQAMEYYGSSETQLLTDIANGDSEKFTNVIWYAKQLFIRSSLSSIIKLSESIKQLLRILSRSRRN